MKLLLLLMIVLSFASCSHQHKEPKHHHEQMPAFLVNHEHENYNFEHGGRTYYFDNEDQKKEFIENLKKEINNSNCVKKGRTRVCSEKKML